MFGNRLGWIIAGVLAFVYLGALVAIESSGSLSAPTALTTAADALDPLSLPPPPLPPTLDTADATPLLQDIIRIVLADRELYERFVSSPSVPSADIPRLAALTPLLAQLTHPTATLYLNQPRDSISYAPESPHVAAMFLAGRAANRVALYHRANGKPDDARPLFLASLSLGHKLFLSRTTHAELSAGLGLMSEAATGLQLLGDPAAPPFLAALATLNDRLTPAWTAISTVDPTTLGKHNGDIHRLALKSNERVFRVESTLKLGRLQYNVGTAGTPADQRQAKKLLKQLLTDPDPAVAHAAQLASELTLENYRTLR